MDKWRNLGIALSGGVDPPSVEQLVHPTNELGVLLRHRPRSIAARRLDWWMKVGPDTGSRPTNESHLNGGVPRSGLLKPLHASPGLGANAFSPLLTTLNPYDCTIPPGFSGSVDVGLSFSPEKTQIELAWNFAPVGWPLPVTSPAKAVPVLSPAITAAHVAALRMW